MKLGGPVLHGGDTPEAWGKALAQTGFAAVPCPVSSKTPPVVAKAYFEEALRQGVVIAEVGVWNNPISPDKATRREALAFAKEQLAFADAMGVACCVNITGAAGEKWDGPYPENYSADTYALVIDSIREIIDAVKPTRTFYSIEPMPWMVPDGPDEYLQLLRDVDRPRLGVHMDFVNMISSAKRYLFAGDFIDECFAKLGPHIKSIHGKDVLLEAPFTTLIREVAPGKGTLDYGRVLRAVNRLSPDMPFLLEHLGTAEEYASAYQYVAGAAKAEGIAIR